FSMTRKLILIFSLVIALALVGYVGLQKYNLKNLSQLFEERFNAGDYLAAVAAAGKLREDGGDIPGLDLKISSAARFLIAEDSFYKAKQAASENRFSDVGALLRSSEAVTDPSFKYYEEAQKLYKEAEAVAAGEAHKTAAAINSLENQAAMEKSKRTAAEKQSETLSGTLKDKEATLKNKEATLVETARKLEASKKEVEVRQAELITEQARVIALAEEVEKKNKQKFFNEFTTYRDLTVKGKEQVDNALIEIVAKRDVTALVYLSQGKILFEEAKTKASDLRTNRTPAYYTAQVDDLQSAISQLLDANKLLRNAVVYIEDQESTEFINNLNSGKISLSNATNALGVVTQFINANPQ
ncbi:MAG: hypothetical protein NUV54_01260, partial [Candidatus Taylorbacteria bacterium]|nr:hypothetical protein [Candidatus Taylorbacteria bacterium]